MPARPVAAPAAESGAASAWAAGADRAEGGPEATVFGGTGFLGRHVAAALAAQGAHVWCPTRAELAAGHHAMRPLGHVVYAIGLTGDFRSRPVDTVEANARLLGALLHETRWTSFLALSSTRVYGADPGTGPWREDMALNVRPTADALYDLSKLTGEALVLGHPAATARVARLSNVFGPGMSEATFLGAILAAARRGEPVVIGEDARSAKDYIAVEHAAAALAAIALGGRERVYNVAGGERIAHADVAAMLAGEGVPIRFAEGGPRRTLPAIDIARLAAEFPAPQDSRRALQAFVSAAIGARR